MKKLSMMMALLALTACDVAQKREINKERMDAGYREAMADYHAGRLDAAIKGLRSVLAHDPSNSSARFQYACLLQDVRHDHRGAFCAFEEFLVQSPNSEKAEIARERVADCEKQLAHLLANKYGLLDKDNLTKELDFVRGELQKTRAQLSDSERESQAKTDRIAALTEERARLVKAVKGDPMVEATSAQSRPSKLEMKDLLEDEDGSNVDRIRMSKDVANLKAEERDELSPGPSIIPARRSDDVARRDAAKAKKDAEAAAAAEYAARKNPSHPPTYTIQDGDTLFRIAARFYGRISAWRKIRDANKALISTDGRVRTGDTIVLP